jgi:UDP-GlcNAc3NAcA epimerase
MKIMTVIGARPQFIKAAVVSHVLRDTPGIEEILVHTGQHYDDNMSRQFFTELDIPEPRYHLKIGSGTHGRQTGRMLEAVERVMLDILPDALLVYGDTNSTLAGALAAAKLHVPIAHVEAGLRSFNRGMPEEINRVVTDHLSTWLFAPTGSAVENLVREGISAPTIHLVGDVMYDAAIHYGRRARCDRLADWNLTAKDYVLATIHRAENTDDVARLRHLFDALALVARTVAVVVPLHPRTKSLLEGAGLWSHYEQSMCLHEPVGYLEMLALEKNARLIVTDSGGVQKEAFFQRVPCVTLRAETEWTELVECGWNTLVSAGDAETISRSIMERLHKGIPATPPDDLYGGGHAAESIAKVLSAAEL